MTGVVSNTPTPGPGNTVYANLWDLITYGASLPSGKCAHNMDSRLAVNAVTMTSGQMRLSAIPLRAGLTIHTIAAGSSAAGAGAITHHWHALYDPNGNLLCQTIDDTTDTTWAATTERPLAVSGSPYVTTANGRYFVGTLLAGAGLPTLAGIAANVGLVGRSPYLGNSNAGTGLTTTAPSTVTPDANPSSPLYISLS